MGVLNEVSLEVNKEGLMKGLRNAFTNKHTVMKEMLQNADRAGATEVKVDVVGVGASLVDISFEDNGCGIADMATLLRVASSGWSEEIMESRMPYGLGFLSALYAASEIELESLGKRLAFKTIDALQFKPIPVLDHAESVNQPGSRFVLRGIEMKQDDARLNILRHGVGYPVKVILNGEENNQSHAVNNPDRKFTQTSIGLVSDPGYDSGLLGHTVVCYLQGFAVKTLHRFPFNINRETVVHLDPTLFVARMPDRDVLIDADEQAKKIELVLAEEWKIKLKELMTKMPANEFVDKYWQAILAFDLDLICKLDLMPKQLVRMFFDVPLMASENLVEFTGHVTREEIESGAVKLVAIPEDFDNHNALSWNYAWYSGACVVNLERIPEGHWARDFIVELDDERLELLVFGEKARGSFSAGWVGGEVIICDSFEIRGEDGKGGALDAVTSNERGVFDGEAFIIPEKESNGDWLVDQASSYLDDDDYQEADNEADRADLRRKILELRGASPAKVMRELLLGIDFYGYQSLHGKLFMLKIDNSGNSFIELLEE